MKTEWRANTEGRLFPLNWLRISIMGKPAGIKRLATCNIQYMLLVERARLHLLETWFLDLPILKVNGTTRFRFETRCKRVARVILLQSWGFIRGFGPQGTLENQQHHKFGTSGTVKKMRNVRFWLSCFWLWNSKNISIIFMSSRIFSVILRERWSFWLSISWKYICIYIIYISIMVFRLQFWPLSKPLKLFSMTFIT